MENEINKFLTEAIGLCWHTPTTKEKYGPYRFYFCSKCKKSLGDFSHITSIENVEMLANLDFFTWQGFGKLWEWCLQQGWWYDFWYQGTAELFGETIAIPRDFQIINPGRFATAIYNFLKERSDQNGQQDK